MKISLRDGSGARAFKFIVEDVDRHGNVRLYFRRTGKPKIRLTATPGTAAFETEYQRAFKGESMPAPTATGRVVTSPESMRWLCVQYYGSAAFLGLGESTRKTRRAILDRICERGGAWRYSEMEPRNIAKLRDEKAALPEAANAIVKALRQLFAWACAPEYAHATKNPARDVPYLKSQNPGGFRIWTEEDVAKYEARHPLGTKARLALDLYLYTGVRKSDVVKLGPQMERGGKLVFSEMKGRTKKVKTHEMPILPPLRMSLDATPSGNLCYLVTAHGRPHSVKAFGNWFKKRCREAGVDADLSGHGLRKLGATRCADAGATEHQLMALFGWSSTKQAALYTLKANRKKLEAVAAPLLMQGRIGNEIVPLIPAVASGGTIRAKKR